MKAEARRTRPRGTMVVHLFVGETPGTCWIRAVNRKNKLAYLENCSEKEMSLKILLSKYILT